MAIQLQYSAQLDAEYSNSLCQQFAITASDAVEGWHLAWHDDALVLRHTQLPKQGDILVDFASGATSYRRLHGGGEAIAKACGMLKKRDITVLDATAGLGRDGFVLANLGASVTLVERNPAVAALLFDGLRRAALVPELHWVAERMQLLHLPADRALQTHTAVDLVYLDPMFPHRDKSALVKKEMQVFRQVVGDDDDASQLLEAALGCARYRVVVKRPRKAPAIAGPEPAARVEGKSSRYDIYPIRALPA